MSEVIPSSISDQHDIEVTQHGLGLDLCQNGLAVHVDESQFAALIEAMSTWTRGAA